MGRDEVHGKDKVAIAGLVSHRLSSSNAETTSGKCQMSAAARLSTQHPEAGGSLKV